MAAQSAGGQLAASNGLLLEDGKTIQGYGIVAADLKNQGHVAGEGPNADDILDLAGSVTGQGYFSGNIRFSGEYSPGNSPATVPIEGNAEFAETSVLRIEIGGTTAGTQFDRLEIDGHVRLGGTLKVVPIELDGGYEFAVGDRFEVMVFTSAEGDFDQYQGLELGNGLALSPQLTNNSLEFVVYELNAWQNSSLSVDVSGDGILSPLDALLVVNWLNSNGGGPVPDAPMAPPPYLDVSGDTFVSPLDALLIVNALNARGAGEGEASVFADHETDNPMPLVAAPQLSIGSVLDRTASTNADLVNDPPEPSLSSNRPALQIGVDQIPISASTDQFWRDENDDLDTEDLLEQLAHDIAESWNQDDVHGRVFR